MVWAQANTIHRQEVGDTATYRYEATVITTTWTSPVYVSVSCPGTDGEATLFTCPGRSSCTEQGTTQQFPLEFVVENYRTCSAVVLNIQLLARSGSVSVTAGNLTKIYAIQPVGMDLAPPNAVFVHCCAALRAVNWTGNITVQSWDENGVVGGQIAYGVPTNPLLLPIDTYYPLARVNVTCNGVNKTSKIAYGNPLPVLSVDDPFLAFWINQLRVGNPWITLNQIPNSLSAVLWNTRYPANGTVGAVDFGLGNLLTDDGEFACELSFPNLVDGKGNSVSNLPNKIVSDSSQCEYSTFSTRKIAFDSLIDALLGRNENITDLTDPDLAVEFIQLGTNIRNSYVWQLCLDEALSFLAESSTVEPVISKWCLEPEGSIGWMQDPCCNETLAATQCCTPSLYQTEITYFATKAENPPGCTYPRCLTQALTTLASFASSGTLDYCSDARLEALAEPEFSDDPWFYCKALANPLSNPCQNDALCYYVHPLSKCDEPGTVQNPKTCTIPCSPDNPCLSGSCNSTIYGDICLNITTPGNQEQNTAVFVDCLLAKIDDYFRVLIEDDIGRLPGYDKSIGPTENFARALTIQACVDPNGEPWPPKSVPPGSLDTEEGCLALQGYCASIGCSLDYNLTTTHCDTLCYRQQPYGGGACVWEYSPFLNVPLSRPALCQIRMSESGDPAYRKNEAACERFGGFYLGPDRYGVRPMDVCITKGPDPFYSTLSPDDCYTSDCIPNDSGEMCLPYCKDISLTSEAACQGSQVNGTTVFPRKWYSWEYNGATYTACVLEGALLLECENELNSTNTKVYFPGYEWLGPILNTQAECEDLGACRYTAGILGYDTSLPPDECYLESCSNCLYPGALDEPRCQTKEACESIPYCNANAGCYVNGPLIKSLGLSVPTQWTPVADLNSSNDNLCWLLIYELGYGYFYSPAPPNTSAACLAAASVCNMGADTPPYGYPEEPPGYSKLNSTECVKCGGVSEPFWDYATGVWEPIRYHTPLTWIDPWPTVTKPHWGPTVDQSLWTSYLTRAKASVLAKISVNELLCKYGYEVAILEQVSCSCSDSETDSCLNDLKTTSGLDIGLQNFCVGISANTTIPNFGQIIVMDTFNITEPKNVSCVSFRGAIVPLMQYTDHQDKLVTSLSIYSETKLLQQYSYFLYNDQSPAVVIGQLLGDGSRLTNDRANLILVNITICLTLNNSNIANWQLRHDVYELSIVGVTNVDEVSNFTRYGVNRRVTDAMRSGSGLTVLCMDMPVENLTLFVAGFVEDAANVQIQNTWKQEETGLIVFIAIAYTLLLLWCAFSLTMRIIGSLLDKNPDKNPNLIRYPEIGLVLLITQCTIRVIYFVGVSYGAFEFHTLSILFTDLPQLLFQGAVILTGIMWNNLADQVAQRPPDRKIGLSFAIMASLFAFYLALSIAYGVLSTDTKVVDCSTTDEERDAITPATAVSLTYKAIFAFYSVSVTLVFTIQAFQILRILHEQPQTAEMNHTIAKFWTASAFSVAGLLIMAAISIYSAVGDMYNTTKLALIIASEIIPTSALAFLYQYKSPFSLVRRMADTVSPTRAVSKTKSSSTSVPKSSKPSTA